MTLRPVVGYQGGKRRLLPRLRTFFPVGDIERYVEPFVGMGALYLDLRGRGYKGSAVLADSHPQVTLFWRMLHEEPELVLRAAEGLGVSPATADRYYAMLKESVDDPAELVARFLWLTNYAFGNAPNVYRGSWSHTTGTKLTSAEKWGKTFPWPKCVERLRAAAAVLDGLPVEVHDDAASALAAGNERSHVYADPPYSGQRRYSGSAGNAYVELVAKAPGACVVLSESMAVAELLAGWERHEGSVVARASGGRGATGHRGEPLYVKRAAPAPVTETVQAALFEDGS